MHFVKKYGMLKWMGFRKNFAKGVDRAMKMWYIIGEESGARSQGVNFAFLSGHIHIDKSALY